MNYIICGDTYNGKFLKKLGSGIRVLTASDLEESDIRFSKGDKLYVPSETALSLVIDRLDDQDTRRGILNLKDKYLCRETLRSLYPDFHFEKCVINDLAELTFPKSRFVIKPQKGFFGTGVRLADANTDMKLLAEELIRDVQANSKFFPDSILSKEEFLLEEYIDGDEYAVDMYYNDQGVPIIINIYRHPEPEISAYAHLMYYSDVTLFSDHLGDFTSLFEQLGKSLNLRNFPIHAEFKLKQGKFIPIEFNPMRYGGFGLADLGYLSYGFLPIQAYFDAIIPDWESIWKSKQEKIYAFILAYNGQGIDPVQSKPDHAKFLEYLGKTARVVDYVRLDHTVNPVFGIAYIETEDRNVLLDLLKMDFCDFFH